MKKYVYQNEKGPTITVFAPYDCNNNCPFCVTKKDYAEHPCYNHHDVWSVNYRMFEYGKITPNCDFVITGGEPFADLYRLAVLVAAVKTMNKHGHNHDLFINTTLPAATGADEIVNFIEEYKDTITGINVSRHVRRYVQECDDEIFNRIPVSVRINCVLFANDEANRVGEIISRFSGYKSITGFQFRENYCNTTLENLYVFEEDSMFANVVRMFKPCDNIEEFFIANVQSKSNFRWNCKIADNINYHRTMPKSTYEIEEGVFQVNDILISPSSTVMNDWNEYGEEMNFEEWKKAEYKEMR